METSKKKNNVVFSIYPNANGFGFVYMENARKLLDYGAVRINPISNRRVMERIQKMIDYFRPSIVIVLDPESKHGRAGDRVKKLVTKILDYAKDEKLPVMQYSRDKVRDVFEQFGAFTKYDISQVLLKEFDELEMRSPRVRQLWASEDRNMAIFDALSLAITWFYLND